MALGIKILTWSKLLFLNSLLKWFSSERLSLLPLFLLFFEECCHPFSVLLK